MIEIIPIGGYSQVEGNSVLIKVDDESIILDMGLSMENYVKYQSQKSINQNKKLTYKELRRVNAVPDYDLIFNEKNTVKAVIPSHAHLDHAGAIPYCMGNFKNVPVLSGSYTIEFLEKELGSTRYKKNFLNNGNELMKLNFNKKYKISNKFFIELFPITHSIPDSAMIIIHTPYGKILYAVDYKFDLQPQIGNPPNFDRLKEFGKNGIKCLIVESLYADVDVETESEESVKAQVKSILKKEKCKNKTIVASTFSSHVARLKTLIEHGLRLDRTVCLVGRSLNTHYFISNKLGYLNYDDIQIYSSAREIKKLLQQVKKNSEKYFLICTGHQGEEFSVLSRIFNNEFGYSFKKEDIMLFSSSVIPTKTNEESFLKLEKKIIKKGLTIYKDIHVSGHAGLKDHYNLINYLKPEYIIPAHAGHEKAKFIKNLSEQMKITKTILASNGDRIVLN